MLPDFSTSRGPRAGAAMDPRSWRAGWRALAAAIAAAILLAAPAAATAADTEHVVQKGQTLGKIAKRYRTTIEAICEANGISRYQKIKPGLVLVIPDRDAPAGSRRGARSAQGKAEATSSRGAKTRVKGVDKAGRKTGADDGASPADSDKRYARRPKRPGWVRLVRGTERLELQLLTPKGRLVPKALPKLSRIMRASPTASIPIDPRLATLIGMVSNHFGGRTIRIVSGYRPYSPTQYTPHSNHNYGRAIDFIVEGVPNTVVRDYCRTFRNAGVGYYPNSTFVHLDVRSEKTYWVDYSRPGEPPRYAGAKGSIGADEAARDVPAAIEEEVYGSFDAPASGAQASNKTGTMHQGPGGGGASVTSPGAGSPATAGASGAPAPSPR